MMMVMVPKTREKWIVKIAAAVPGGTSARFLEVLCWIHSGRQTGRNRETGASRECVLYFGTCAVRTGSISVSRAQKKAKGFGDGNVIDCQWRFDSNTVRMPGNDVITFVRAVWCACVRKPCGLVRSVTAVSAELVVAKTSYMSADKARRVRLTLPLLHKSMICMSFVVFRLYFTSLKW